MEYKHIDDCWNAIRNAKTIEEVERLFETFPRWSGDWSIETEKFDCGEEAYTVINCFTDSEGNFEIDRETLDIFTSSKEIENLSKKLQEIYDMLDELQETNYAQSNEAIIWEIGEAMGSVDNALTIIEESNRHFD